MPEWFLSMGVYKVVPPVLTRCIKECPEAYRRIRLSVTTPKFNNSNWPNRETTKGVIAKSSLKSPCVF